MEPDDAAMTAVRSGHLVTTSHVDVFMSYITHLPVAVMSLLVVRVIFSGCEIRNSGVEKRSFATLFRSRRPYSMIFNDVCGYVPKTCVIGVGDGREDRSSKSQPRLAALVTVISCQEIRASKPSKSAYCFSKTAQTVVPK